MTTGVLVVMLLTVVLWRLTRRTRPAARLRVLYPDRPSGPGRSRSRPRLPLPVVSVVGGLGVALVVGGAWGVLLGAACVLTVLRVVPRLESRQGRARRSALVAQAPDVLDLLAACLASGATVEAAVAATGAALDDPAAELLGLVAAQLRLGADPALAWAVVAAEEPLAPLAVAVERSAGSGAALGDALPAAADDLRARRRSDLEVQARRVGVRLTAPLGLAFLPAFVLLGIVPVVASLVSGVLTLG